MRHLPSFVLAIFFALSTSPIHAKNPEETSKINRAKLECAKKSVSSGLTRVDIRENEGQKTARLNGIVKRYEAQIATFKKKYRYEQPDDLKNELYRRLAVEALRDPGNIYFFVSNNVLQKELNDSILRDKDLVNSINQMRRDLFRETLAKYPELANIIKASFIDYKSIRLAVDAKKVQDIETFANKLKEFETIVNTEFEKRLLAEDFIYDYISPLSGFASIPEAWFRWGIGTSDYRAVVMMRAQEHRTVESINADKTFLTENGHFTNHVRISRQNVEHQYHDIENNVLTKPGARKLFSPSLNNKSVLLPKTELFDTFRKVPSVGTRQAKYEWLQDTIRSRFDVEVDEPTLIAIENYIRALEGVSTSSLGGGSLDAVEVLRGATNGAFDVDISMQGARNMRAIAEAVVRSKGKNELDFEDSIAEEYDRATEQLIVIRDFIIRVLQKHLPKNIGRTEGSGDDLISAINLFKGQLDNKTILNILRDLASGVGFKGEFFKRSLIKFVNIKPIKRNGVVAAEKMAELGSQGHKIADGIRKQLVAKKVPAKLLDDLLIVPSMSYDHSKKKSSVSLSVFSNPDATGKIPQEVQQIIIEALKKSAKDQNAVVVPTKFSVGRKTREEVHFETVNYTNLIRQTYFFFPVRNFNSRTSVFLFSDFSQYKSLSF